MTKAKPGHLKKNGTCVREGGGESEQTLFYFQLKFDLTHGHARFFQLQLRSFWRDLLPRPEQLVRSTPLLPGAMP